MKKNSLERTFLIVDPLNGEAIGFAAQHNRNAYLGEFFPVGHMM